MKKVDETLMIDNESSEIKGWQSDFEKIYSSGEFDFSWYLARYPDVPRSGLSPLEHYVKYGAHIDRLPNSGFDPKYTIPQKPYVNPFVKYLEEKSPLTELKNEHTLPLVSVICISYNQELYIRQALMSIVEQQTDFVFEVLVGDDNSSDRTPIIIREIAERYPSVIPYFRKVNLGANTNFQELARQARGKYLAICEGDDYWTDKTKLQRQVNFLNKRPEFTICFHQVEVLYEGIPGTNTFYPDNCAAEVSLESLIKNNWIQTNSVMYRWRYIDRETFSLNPKMAPGDWYMHLMHAEVGRVGYINRTMAVYRKNTGGMWASHKSELDRHKKLGNAEIEFFREVKGHFGGQYDINFLGAQQYLADLLADAYIGEADYDSLFTFLNINTDIVPSRLARMGFDTAVVAAPDPARLGHAVRQQQRVSVIVTSYNHAGYIGRCIDSILAQKGEFELEIVIGDDCSSDRTAEVIEEYRRSNPDKITVRPRPLNLGMLKNMADCLSVCTGTYIAFCEADDYWLSDRKLERQISYMRRDPSVSLCFNWVLLHLEEDGVFVPHPEQSMLTTGYIDFFELARKPITANLSCFLVRATAANDIAPAFFSHSSAADWLFALYAADRGRVAFMRELLSVYTVQSQGQWSGLPDAVKSEAVSSLRHEYRSIFGRSRGFEDLEICARVTRFNIDAFADLFSANLDQPIPDIWVPLAKSYIELSGWAIPFVGSNVTVLSRVNGETYRHTPNIERQDVTKVFFPNGKTVSKESRPSGFQISFTYHSGIAISLFAEIQGHAYQFAEIVFEERVT